MYVLGEGTRAMCQINGSPMAGSVGAASGPLGGPAPVTPKSGLGGASDLKAPFDPKAPAKGGPLGSALGGAAQLGGSADLSGVLSSLQQVVQALSALVAKLTSGTPPFGGGIDPIQQTPVGQLPTTDPDGRPIDGVLRMEPAPVIQGPEQAVRMIKDILARRQMSVSQVEQALAQSPGNKAAAQRLEIERANVRDLQDLAALVEANQSTLSKLEAQVAVAMAEDSATMGQMNYAAMLRLRSEILNLQGPGIEYVIGAGDVLNRRAQMAGQQLVMQAMEAESNAAGGGTSDALNAKTRELYQNTREAFAALNKIVPHADKLSATQLNQIRTAVSGLAPDKATLNAIAASFG